MPEENSLLVQLEEWLEAQVPNNLGELPYRLYETMERITEEICTFSSSLPISIAAEVGLVETLNIQGPSSISIPFPPFTLKQPPPPLPPLPPPTTVELYTQRAEKLVKSHPYVSGVGVALAVSVGLGVGAMAFKYGTFRLGGPVGVRGQVSEGMLKEAVGTYRRLYL
jgi:hypothetical protein